MNTKRIIDSFCKYYSCCYEAHVLRLEHGTNRFAVQEYLSARDKAAALKKELSAQQRALSALDLEARLEAERHFRESRE